MPNKKRYPVQRIISVQQPVGPPAADGLIDVPAQLSRVNHRLYRQSRVYDCKVTIDGNVADATTVDVYALADTWYLSGALKLAKSVWDETVKEEIMANNGRVARWNDFRVVPGLTGTGNLDAVQFNRAILTSGSFAGQGEFVDTTVEDQSGNLRSFTLGTPSANTYNIIEQYDAQPGASADPENPSTGPYSGLMPNLSAFNADAISDDGNLPPYNATGYGTAYWVKVGTLHLASGRQKLSTGFFKAPLGMVVLRNVAWLGDPDIQVEIKGGDYKGVSASNMLE